MLSSDPNQTLRLVVSHKLTETAFANMFCFPLFNCQRTTSSILLNSPARNKPISLSLKTGEEHLPNIPTAGELGVSS